MTTRYICKKCGRQYDNFLFMGISSLNTTKTNISNFTYDTRTIQIYTLKKESVNETLKLTRCDDSLCHNHDVIIYLCIRAHIGIKILMMDINSDIMFSSVFQPRTKYYGMLRSISVCNMSRTRLTSVAKKHSFVSLCIPIRSISQKHSKCEM